jgi:hypothetical protein
MFDFRILVQQTFCKMRNVSLFLKINIEKPKVRVVVVVLGGGK